MNIIQNAFTENLAKGEFVAVNPAGIPIGRASSKESLERAHPDGTATILSAAEVGAAQPTLAEAATAGLEGPFAAVVAQGVIETAPEPKPAKTEPVAPAKVDPLDHDADGKKGGHKLNADKVAIDKKTATAHTKTSK